MKDFPQQFDFYDYLAHMFVGVYFFTFTAIAAVFWSGIKFSTLFKWMSGNIVLLLILAFLLGHVIQAISNFFDPWENNYGNKPDTLTERIYLKARKFFGLPSEYDDKKVWTYCYLHVLSNDETGHIKRFNSLSGLYRGLRASSKVVGSLLAIYLLSRFFTTSLFLSSGDPLAFRNSFLLMMLLFFMSHLFGTRKKSFNRTLSEKVLMIFDMQIKDSDQTESKNGALPN